MSMLWARNRLNKLPEECFKFSLILIHLANGQWHFKQANHGTYSNPGTQVGALNKDFGDVSQTDKPELDCVCRRGLYTVAL